MTLLDRRGARLSLSPGQGPERAGPAGDGARTVNVGGNERAVSIAAGSALSLLGLSRMSVPGLLVAGVGGAMIYRGATGRCLAYAALDLNTAEESDEGPRSSEGRSTEESLNRRGIHVEQAFLINRSSEDLYRFWRDFTNLPRIMTHLQSVEVTGDRKSHWVASAPGIVGGKVEWDAEITQDEPNSMLAWRSLPGSTIDCAGSVRFAKAMGDRGTEVHVSMDYLPPGGRVGHWVATLFGKSPRKQMRDDLRNFKRVMEIGEVLTTAGQPRGTCTGEGKRESQ